MVIREVRCVLKSGQLHARVEVDVAACTDPLIELGEALVALVFEVAGGAAQGIERLYARLGARVVRDVCVTGQTGSVAHALERDGVTEPAVVGEEVVLPGDLTGVPVPLQPARVDRNRQEHRQGGVPASPDRHRGGSAG